MCQRRRSSLFYSLVGTEEMKLIVPQCPSGPGAHSGESKLTQALFSRSFQSRTEKREQAKAHTNKPEMTNSERKCEGALLVPSRGSSRYLGFKEGFKEGFQEGVTFELRLETQAGVGQKYEKDTYQ